MPKGQRAAIRSVAGVAVDASAGSGSVVSCVAVVAAPGSGVVAELKGVDVGGGGVARSWQPANSNPNNPHTRIK